jgi:O-antigen biosynthesis protein
LLSSWGCRLLRLFEMPDQAFLDACQENGLGVMLTLPWTDHLDFLTNPAQRSATLAEIREAASGFAAHPALCCLLVGNEIRAELVRWLGPTPVRRFLEEAIEIVREICPGRLVGYASFPSTEYLLPANADFMGVNLYLEKETNYQSYLARLQALAGDLPLVLTEFGTLYKPDAPDEQATIWRWALDGALKSGVAAMVGFSFTDEWWRGWPTSIRLALRIDR